eukprot:685999-Prorocentrum_minimum.AAC.1
MGTEATHLGKGGVAVRKLQPHLNLVALPIGGNVQVPQPVGGVGFYVGGAARGDLPPGDVDSQQERHLAEIRRPKREGRPEVSERSAATWRRERNPIGAPPGGIRRRRERVGKAGGAKGSDPGWSATWRRSDGGGSESGRGAWGPEGSECGRRATRAAIMQTEIIRSRILACQKWTQLRGQRWQAGHGGYLCGIAHQIVEFDRLIASWGILGGV